MSALDLGEVCTYLWLCERLVDRREEQAALDRRLVDDDGFRFLWQRHGESTGVEQRCNAQANPMQAREASMEMPTMLRTPCASSSAL